MKDIPVLYQRKEECCGCTACYASCTVGAISMIPDEEGFLYPEIDMQKCISCKKCLRVCPVKASNADILKYDVYPKKTEDKRF